LQTPGPMKRTFALWLLLAAGGCGGGGTTHSIAASEFQVSCSIDADCVSVYEGTIGCCGGGCPNAAINKASTTAYDAALASRTPQCSPAPPCADFARPICPTAAICDNGTCAYAQLGADAAASD